MKSFAVSIAVGCELFKRLVFHQNIVNLFVVFLILEIKRFSNVNTLSLK